MPVNIDMVQSRHSAFYERFHLHVPGEQFIFMNHGFAELSGDGDLPWLEDYDRRYLFNALLLERVVRDVQLRDATVLDIGCGRGGNCVFLARYYRPRTLVGLDYSRGAMDFCNRTHGGTNIRFAQASAMALPVRDTSIDCVVSIESSHSYPDPKRFFSEVLRVLKPGGIFCYADCLPGSITTQMEKVLRNLGFVIRDCADITANVARGIESGRDAYRRALLESCESAEGIRLAESLLASIDGTIHDNYLSGVNRYGVWQGHKA